MSESVLAAESGLLVMVHGHSHGTSKRGRCSSEGLNRRREWMVEDPLARHHS